MHCSAFLSASIRRLTSVAAILLAAIPAFGQGSSPYKVLRSIPVGGKGGWDYIAIQKDAHRIYVSHDTLVNIIDEVSGDSIGTIPNTRGVHGIAFAVPFGKGYTSNGRAKTSSVFDLKTGKPLRDITTGDNPDAIMFDAFSSSIITCNGRSSDLTVIDPAADTVRATVPVGGKPEAPVSDGAGHMYINIEDKNEVVEITTSGWTVTHRWSVAPGDGPTGIAMDRTTKRLFVGCDKQLIVLNAQSGAVVKVLPIGDRCDGVAFDPAVGSIFTSNGEGTITRIEEVNADSFRVAETIPTKRGARTIALDDETHHLFLPTAEYEAATPESPRPRTKVVPGSFQVLEVGE